MQNNFYAQLKIFLHTLDMEKAYLEANFHLDFMRDVENFLENKSNEQKKLVIDELYNDAIDFKTKIKKWSHHPLTKWLQDRSNQPGQNLTITIPSDKTMQKQHRKKKIYKSLDEIVGKEVLDEIVIKLEQNGYINRLIKNEIRFINPPYQKSALIRRLVIVGTILMKHHIKTSCSYRELWMALTKYFNVTGSYQNFKTDERFQAEPYKEEFTFLLPT